MQPGELAAGAAQREKAVVVDGYVPEIGRRRTEGELELAQEPAREVDEMRALVDQLAAAGKLGSAAPFALVARPSAMAVAAANEEQRADIAGERHRMRLGDRRMEAMVEADLDDALVPAGGRRDRRHLGGAASGRLLDEDVLAGLDRRQRDLRLAVVHGGDDDGVDLGGDGLAASAS